MVFTWEFATDPATAATSSVAYENIHRIDKLNDHTVKVVFKEPTPLGLTDGGAPVLPRHRFAEYKGANARNAPYNLKAVGTGHSGGGDCGCALPYRGPESVRRHHVGGGQTALAVNQPHPNPLPAGEGIRQAEEKGLL